MDIIFEDKDLEELILQGKNNKYKKYTKDARFMQALGRIYSSMVNATTTSLLSNLSFLHYEKLKGINQSSVRVMNGRVERILFRACTVLANAIMWMKENKLSRDAWRQRAEKYFNKDERFLDYIRLYEELVT